MKQYFEKMASIGKELNEKDRGQNRENAEAISKVDRDIAEALEKRKLAGTPAEWVHKRGDTTAG